MIGEQFKPESGREQKYEKVQKNIEDFLRKFVTMDAQRMDAFSNKYGQYAFQIDNNWWEDDKEKSGGGMQEKVKDDDFKVKIIHISQNSPGMVLFKMNDEGNYAIAGELFEAIQNGEFKG